MDDKEFDWFFKLVAILASILILSISFLLIAIGWRILNGLPVLT